MSILYANHILNKVLHIFYFKLPKSPNFPSSSQPKISSVKTRGFFPQRLQFLENFSISKQGWPRVGGGDCRQGLSQSNPLPPL